MTANTSVSLTDEQEAFARGLVERGEYSSLSAVLQRGLEMLRWESEGREAELLALRVLIDRRREGGGLWRSRWGRRRRGGWWRVKGKCVRGYSVLRAAEMSRDLELIGEYLGPAYQDFGDELENGVEFGGKVVDASMRWHDGVAPFRS